MRDGFLVEDEIEEREVRLIVVYRCVHVWDERWGATNAIELKVEESKTRQDEVKGALTCSKYLGLDTSNP